MKKIIVIETPKETRNKNERYWRSLRFQQMESDSVKLSYIHGGSSSYWMERHVSNPAYVRRLLREEVKSL